MNARNPWHWPTALFTAILTVPFAAVWGMMLDGCCL
jgi:hypothetical protein